MPTSFYAKNSNRLPSLSCYLKYYMHAQLLQHHTGETVLPYETAVLVFCLFVFLATRLDLFQGYLQILDGEACGHASVSNKPVCTGRTGRTGH